MSRDRTAARRSGKRKERVNGVAPDSSDPPNHSPFSSRIVVALTSNIPQLTVLIRAESVTHTPAHLTRPLEDPFANPKRHADPDCRSKSGAVTTILSARSSSAVDFTFPTLTDWDSDPLRPRLGRGAMHVFRRRRDNLDHSTRSSRARFGSSLEREIPIPDETTPVCSVRAG